MSKALLQALFICFGIYTGQAQWELTSEFRPRLEYRQGFNQPILKGQKPITFVSQRTRIQSDFRSPQFRLYASLQNVRVWGDVPQLNREDTNGLAFHQIFAELYIHPQWTLKLGRQELNYDTHRILGNVGWAQQARSHDLVLLRWHKSSAEFHLGAAYNQNSEGLTDQTPLSGTYKALQLLWYHRTSDHGKWSILLLNNGMPLSYFEVEPETSDIQYSQTIGFYWDRNFGRWEATLEGYHQTGKDPQARPLEAYLGRLELHYNKQAKLSPVLGAEYISGNSRGEVQSQTNRAFSPLYGTNHKFNGLMDYFYVGNHQNSVGLIDTAVGFNWRPSKGSVLRLKAHRFMAAAEMPRNVNSRDLATELDIVYQKNVSPQMSFWLGASYLSATNGLQTLRHPLSKSRNSWFWAMLQIKPTLF